MNKYINIIIYDIVCNDRLNQNYFSFFLFLSNIHTVRDLLLWTIIINNDEFIYMKYVLCAYIQSSILSKQPPLIIF